jgi:hypothetical protein
VGLEAFDAEKRNLVKKRLHEMLGVYLIAQENTKDSYP